MELIDLEKLEVDYMFSEFFAVNESNPYQQALERQVSKRLQVFLTSPQTVFQQFSLVSWELMKIMDYSFKPKLPAQDLATAIQNQATFSNELLDLVNSPVFQRGSKKHREKIETTKHAIAYLGNGAMKLIIPYFILRKQTAEESKLLRKSTLKFWKETLSTAIYTCELCELRDNPNYLEAFSTSVMVGLCKFLIGKAYIDIFTTVKDAYLEQSRRKFDLKRVRGFEPCTPSHKAVSEAVNSHWLDFSIAISEKADFNYLSIHQNLQSIREEQQADCEFIQIYQIAYYYNMIINLRKNRYLSGEEADKISQKAQIDLAEMKQLKSLKLTLRRMFSKEKHSIKMTDMLRTEKAKDDRTQGTAKIRKLDKF